ncbi:hypothetical protein [Pelagerythrobacter sp.]|uniref:hypothetical protein n=1 Tax=Pelagerythrobacter sp. TaxID=2800702 RepID=UPI0035B46E55
MIIVRAKRWGQADIEAEAAIKENEIESFGANTIGELLDAISPVLDPSGGEPELLVNGKRITNPAELEDYPKEALAQISLLPREAAAAYGVEQDKRVVNLELKQHFASWTGEAAVQTPTSGGRRSVALTAGRFTIDQDTRWNVGATFSHDSELLRSERSLPAQAAPLEWTGGPDDAGAQFDPDDDTALLPRAQSIGFNANVTHPVGSFSGTLNLAANRNNSTLKIGPPVVISRPASNPLEPRLLEDRRGLASRSALKYLQNSRSFSTGISLTGAVGGWQSNIGLRYSVNWAESVRQLGYAEITSPRPGDMDANPSVAGLSRTPQADRLRSTTETYNLSLTSGNSIVTVPAGQARASLSFNANHLRSKVTGAGTVTNDNTTSSNASEQFDGLLSLSVPVASASADFLKPLGELTVSTTAAFRKVSGAAMNFRLGSALDWSPVTSVNLRVAYSRENSEPTYNELYAPRVEILNRVFDFTRGEYVQPLFRFGGNENLAGGSLKILSADLFATPFGQNFVSLDFGYRHTIARGGVASFPELTPDVETAFPERIYRDQTGRLVAIDARPINIGFDETRRLTSGLSLRWSEDSGVLEDAKPPWTITSSLTFQWDLENETEIRPGLGVIDRLEGLGQARHSAEFQLNVGRNGLGVTLGGTWTGPASVNGGSEVQYRYPASTTVNLGAFVEPASLMAKESNNEWIEALKLSVDVQNVFDSRRSIESSTGLEGYSRDELDPLGRTIRFAASVQF